MKRILVFFVLAMVVLGSCSNKQKIVGTWTDVEGYTWTFSADGILTYDSGSHHEYQYNVADNKITIFKVRSWTDLNQTFVISFSGKTLKLLGGHDMEGWSVAGPGWGTNELTRK
ncbi:MAG: hypothetical protein LBQ82_00675 [Treponema sp.]|jgi:hypothetical protein|nr:hypothetical protein [Treponema sp.]